MTYLERLQEALSRISFGNALSYEENMISIRAIFQRVREKNRTLYFIGNGGSAGIAVHMTSDFLKNACVKTHSMHDPATLTCLANDFEYSFVFSKQLEQVAEEGDLLVAISSSGESENILQAALAGRKKRCKVLTLTGFRETNRLRKMGDDNIYVPSMEYGIVETIHNLILQQIVDEIAAQDKKRM